MSLTRPHPIWTTCGSNPFESHKASIASRMLSGRYLTDKLQRHWTMNKTGVCLLPTCSPPAEGSLEHILLHCPAVSETCAKILKLCSKSYYRERSTANRKYRLCPVKWQSISENTINSGLLEIAWHNQDYPNIGPTD